MADFPGGKLGAENDRNRRRDRRGPRGFRARLALSGMGRKAEKYPINWESYWVPLIFQKWDHSTRKNKLILPKVFNKRLKINKMGEYNYVHYYFNSSSR